MSKATNSQVQALINEYKGNLFEFLLGQHLAQTIDKETDYIKSIPPHFLQKLKSYEADIRTYDAHIIVQLKNLAKAFYQSVASQFSQHYTKVLLQGKLNANGSQTEQTHQTDLCLMGEDETPIRLSLKLCKHHSFINCKSAGIKSFIREYVPHPQRSIEQEQLNLCFSQWYEEFSQNIHDNEAIAYHPQFKNWIAHNKTILPGQLSTKNREQLMIFYNKIMQRIYDLIIQLDQEKLNEFALRLCGLNADAPTQLICYHKGTDSYQFHSSLILSRNIIEKKLPKLQWKIQPCDPTKSAASIHLESPLGILQIRIKAMNSFVSGGFKVNCAIRYAAS